MLVYRDPVEEVTGYLVIDQTVDGVAAGGLRISPSLSLSELKLLARSMTRKQAALGIRVGGAKAGLAMEPSAPYRREVLGRFLEFLQPTIEQTYSVGPDMNTTLSELEALGRALGIPSLKIAVARTKAIPDEVFLRRYGLFEARTEQGKVNELRAPAGVAAAVATLAEFLERPVKGASIAIQGAGTMGRGTARLLHDAGARIVAWADEHLCLLDPAGLDVPRLVDDGELGRLVHGTSPPHAREAVLTVPCDILVLAAISDAVPPSRVESLRCDGIVVAANLGLSPEAEDAIFDRGIWIVPDTLASAGGSLAVESLYRAGAQTPEAILEHVHRRVREAVGSMLSDSRSRGVSPRRVLDLGEP